MWIIWFGDCMHPVNAIHGRVQGGETGPSFTAQIPKHGWENRRRRIRCAGIYLQRASPGTVAEHHGKLQERTEGKGLAH